MTDYTKITEKLLDQYRCGLLDDDPETKHRVETALANDPSLAKQFDRWDHIAESLSSADPVTPAITTRLERARTQAARAQVLRQPLRPRSINFQYTGMAIAASLALTIGLTMFFGNEQSPPELTAGFELESNPMMVSSFSAELNENLDFYVWLESESGFDSQPKGI